MNVCNSRLLVLFLLLIGSYSTGALAHKGIKHTIDERTEVAVERPDAVAKVRTSYIQQIDTLLKRGCGDCHSDDTRYPWYAKLPFVDSLIANDITEAKEHLDLSAGFPFEGHGNPIEDLRAIRDVIQDNSMPPLGYRLLHRSQELSKKEKDLVFQWIEESLIQLENKK